MQISAMPRFSDASLIVFFHFVNFTRKIFHSQYFELSHVAIFVMLPISVILILPCAEFPVSCLLLFVLRQYNTLNVHVFRMALKAIG